MPSLLNIRYVEQLEQQLDGCQGIVLLSFQGVPHREFEALRRKFRENQGIFRVVKNTLLRLALERKGFPVPDGFLIGPTAVGIAYGEPTVAAKLLLEFVKEHPTCAIKGGLLGAQILDADGVEALSKMPSREELLAQALACVGSPVAALTRLLGAPVALLSLYLKTLAEGQGGSPSLPDQPISP